MKRIINNILLQRKKLMESKKINVDCTWFDRSKINGLGDLVRVLYHPDSVHFCMVNNFPSMDIFKHFRCMNVERYNVYIDAGEISLTNIDRAYLIGDTVADIVCSRGRSKIIATHGAKANISARGYSVVEAFCNGDSKINVAHSDKAKVLVNINGKWK